MTRKWVLAGLLLAAPLAAISAISPTLAQEGAGDTPFIIPLVLLMTAAGSVYLVAMLLLKDFLLHKGQLAWIILLGLFLRLSMFGSTPILEDDFYRYMWDGAVLAHGFNPYRHAPQEVLHGKSAQVPTGLRQLAEEGGHVLEKMNYPRLRTIYPPVAQAAFALAYVISPWSLTGWRIILLLLDGLTLYLLSLLLRAIGLPLTGLAIYWWNPLLVKEIYNSGHMEMILLPFLVAALLFTVRQRVIPASVSLGCAVGTKFWPVLLVPVVWRPLLRDPKRLIPALFMFVGISTAMFLPLLLTGLDSRSGLAAYSKYWEMNDALFMVILWAVRFGMDLFHAGMGGAQGITRMMIAALLLCSTLWIVRRPDNAPKETCRRFLVVTSALFLFSPTQFPWYYLWVLPFLSILPRLSLLLLTPLLSLYYLRYFLQAKGVVHIHDNGIVWVEFAPVWFLLIWEWASERRRPAHSAGRTQSEGNP